MRLGRLLDECRREGRRVGSRGGGDQALDADRVPEVGDPHPSLGRRGAG